MLRRWLGLTPDEIVVPAVDRALLTPSPELDARYQAAVAAGDTATSSVLGIERVEELESLIEARRIIAGLPLDGQPADNQAQH